MWKFPGLGSNWSDSCRPTPWPQQWWIRAESVTYTTAHSNAGSPTHWAKPGIEPTSSWTRVRFVAAVSWRTLPPSYYLHWCVNRFNWVFYLDNHIICSYSFVSFSYVCLTFPVLLHTPCPPVHCGKFLCSDISWGWFVFFFLLILMGMILVFHLILGFVCTLGKPWKLVLFLSSFAKSLKNKTIMMLEFHQRLFLFLLKSLHSALDTPCIPLRGSQP